ncbi:MAG: hypothetical protein OEY41_08110 [Acidimicrobiia bacterium]|nr:hypothetical protein [Acidimicrobiia bacterium]MDH4363279.1 hypothetical protein [Acidimicrobiia bacterium]MDH5289948.1 hypothetical protein [Acidimicrobiia bacterium]
MKRLATTVVAVVGDEAEACLRALAGAANVATVAVPAEPPPDDPWTRAQEAWRRTVRSKARFTVHAVDPLAEVGDAWAAGFDLVAPGAAGSSGARGRLEVAVAGTLARWRADTIGLPDYYLVLAPDDLPSDLRHWYLGVLHRAAPHRVVPVAAEREAVLAAIARLPAGRWWPELPELLSGLDHELPDRPMVPAPPPT